MKRATSDSCESLRTKQTMVDDRKFRFDTSNPKSLRIHEPKFCTRHFLGTTGYEFVTAP